MNLTEDLHMRVSVDLMNYLYEISRTKGIKPSTLARMIITENIQKYTVKSEV